MTSRTSGVGEFFGSSFRENADAGAAAAKRKNLPKILLMGLRRSGKSSIQKVVFHKMTPTGTLFLESTNVVVKEDVANSSFVHFSIWDFPGQIDFVDASLNEEALEDCGAIIYVIDAQDDYTDAMHKLRETIVKAAAAKSNIHFEVFIHKVDGLSDETKIETQRDISQRWADDCAELGLDGRVQLNFYLTSIYDHSIFEAMSKVVQKLIPELGTLEGLLNIFTQNSGIEKAFLFDVVSKIYIATDSSPVDIQSYELCCDMLDLVIDVSFIYGAENEGNAFDARSGSVIRLNNNTVLYLREVSKVLALICILRAENYNKPGLLDYNFSVIREGVHKIFEVRRRFGKMSGNEGEEGKKKVTNARKDE